MQLHTEPKKRQARPDAITPAALRPWPFPALTQQQQVERRCLEEALAADQLRGLPTCFGALS